MSRDPYAPPASKKEQLSEVARILGRALHRWHRLNRGKAVNARPASNQSDSNGQAGGGARQESNSTSGE